jgi:predicted transposase YdaD
MPTPKLTNEVVVAAILGFEEQKRKIDAQIADLRQMLTEGPTIPLAASEAPRRGRRKMSAAGRKAIAEAQRKRWAASKGESNTAVGSQPKRKLSAAGKAAIVAALKKRWAAKKAEAATRPSKKTAAKQ